VDQNPLTDPTSLIAYRLANAKSMSAKRSTRGAPGASRRDAPGTARIGAVIAIGLLLAVALLVWI
jgi:hypothetical protein